MSTTILPIDSFAAMVPVDNSAIVTSVWLVVLQMLYEDLLT